jgi:hypothetical protein
MLTDGFEGTRERLQEAMERADRGQLAAPSSDGAGGDQGSQAAMEVISSADDLKSFLGMADGALRAGLGIPQRDGLEFDFDDPLDVSAKLMLPWVRANAGKMGPQHMAALGAVVLVADTLGDVPPETWREWTGQGPPEDADEEAPEFGRQEDF